MSYTFRSDRTYRMPTHFGPLPGPRQAPSGGSHALDETQKTTLIWASFEADREHITTLLPGGFEPLDTADLTVEIKNMANIGWLAGRGYSVATITTGVRRLASDDGYPAEGRFKLVLWENHADPIITGREELGYPKVFGDITDIVISADHAHASVSWGGYTFLELDVRDITSVSTPQPGGDSFHLKYIPRTGGYGHDLAQTVLTPSGQGPLVVDERLGGVGSLTIAPATWEQLPTLVTIVNALADVTVGACLGAGLTRTTGTTDLRDQIVIS